MPTTTAPSDWIRRFAASLRPGSRILDLACGAGRHARFLVDAGHHVTAVDANLEGVADLRDDPSVRLLQTDLEDGAPWPLDGERFDLVIVTNYLHRPILPKIVAAVDAGGMLLYETFARGNEGFGKPSNPAFLLEAGELLDTVRDRLDVVAFEQGLATQPKKAIVQRICAIRPDDRAVPFQSPLD